MRRHYDQRYTRPPPRFPRHPSLNREAFARNSYHPNEWPQLAPIRNSGSPSSPLAKPHNQKDTTVPRIPPIPRPDLPEFEPLFEQIERHLGVLPNSTLTMAHRPEIMRHFAKLNEVVMGPGLVDRGLKQLVVLAASAAAGCNYCQAHTAHVATKRDVPVEKVEAVWEFETSGLFDEAERAALRVAFAAGQVPNQVTDQEMEDLRGHFSDAEVVEIVAAIAVFGFLNRWNDTMATALESAPLTFADHHLEETGWDVGKHG